MEIVTADIGGTHARFAIAEVADGRVQSLGEAVTLKTVDYASLQTAWEAFAAQLGRALPRAAGIAVACPVDGELLQLTNNPWVIRPALIAERLGLDRYVLINDFAAVAHAVGQIDPAHLRHIAGPSLEHGADGAGDGAWSIVGPGTGLGVAQLLRKGAHIHVIPTEGGHIDFAPLDSLEDALLSFLRTRYRRVSVERVVSGPGLANIYEALAQIEGRAVPSRDDKALWAAAIAGEDSLAEAALDRWCLSLGSVAGDIALAQGAKVLVLAGGLIPRIGDLLPRSGFASRFTAKGRFEARMATIPVLHISHPQPGLFGAAAAFAASGQMSSD